MSRLLLYIYEPGKSPRSVPAQVGQKIGRSRESDIPVEDPKVGRLHLEIVQMGEVLGVTDLNSKNGTRLNGTEIPRNTPQPVLHGAELGIGDTTLKVDLSAATGDAPPPPRDPSATMSAGGDSLSDSGTMHVPRPARPGAPAPEGGEGTQLVGRPPAANQPPAPAADGGTMKVKRPRPGGAPAPGGTPAPPPAADGGTMKVSRPRPGGGAPAQPPADGGTMKVSRPRAGGGTPPPAAPDGGTMKVSRPRPGGAPAQPPAPDGGTMKVSRPRGAAPPPAGDPPATPAPAGPAPAHDPQPPAEAHQVAPAQQPPAATPPAAASDEAATDSGPAPALGAPMQVGTQGPTLILVNPNLQTTKGIPTVPYTIGRQDGQSWQIGDDRISREHAVVGFDGSSFTIMDCGSSGGTTVSGNRLAPNQPTRLNDGDHVVLGSLDFYFFLDTPEKRSARASKHKAAVQLLAKQKKLSKAAAGRVLSRAKAGERDAADLALQEGEISVKDWIDAVDRAKTGPGAVVLIVGLLVLAGAAFGVLKWQGII